jgi:aryl-alcohol dehydrogenase-like predicted oxidoreductase
VRYIEAGGARVSVIGLGTWQFGSREWAYGERYAQDVAPRLVERALEAGITLFDSAEIYGFGRSERILGAALAGRRQGAFVATKILPVLPLGSVVGARARASARRLGVSTIDLYQLHFPNPLVPLSSSMAGMRRLRESGLIGHVGVSNYGLGRWQAADRALGGPVLSNQVEFSLLARSAELDLVPFAAAQDRLVIAYSPLGKGLLGGRYWDGPNPGGLRRGVPDFSRGARERLQPLRQALDRVADRLGATPAQTALAWVVAHPNTVAIPGASSEDQVAQNAAAGDLVLAQSDLDELASAATAAGV